MGSHKRILSRGVTLFKLYFRIRLLSVEREQTVCAGVGWGRGSRKASGKATARVQVVMREGQTKVVKEEVCGVLF